MGFTTKDLREIIDKMKASSSYTDDKIESECWTATEAKHRWAVTEDIYINKGLDKAKQILNKYASLRLLMLTHEISYTIEQHSAIYSSACDVINKEIFLGILPDITRDYEIDLLSTLCHEIGHILTFDPLNHTKRQFRDGKFSKHILICELKASAWALRWLKKHTNINIALARICLYDAYLSYKKHYNKDLDSSCNIVPEHVLL